ncbi:MAG: hypothetical protein IT432_12585 [Phycisphaerales bacterium]|nr:hypothetical protein [Phycisphaerales bacterium]
MRPAYGIALTIQRALPDTKGAFYAFRRGYTVVFGHDPADAERVKREVSEVLYEGDTAGRPAKEGPFTWAIIVPDDQADAMLDLLFGGEDDARADAEAAILSARLPISWRSPEPGRRS